MRSQEEGSIEEDSKEPDTQNEIPLLEEEEEEENEQGEESTKEKNTENKEESIKEENEANIEENGKWKLSGDFIVYVSHENLNFTVSFIYKNMFIINIENLPSPFSAEEDPDNGENNEEEDSEDIKNEKEEKEDFEEPVEFPDTVVEMSHIGGAQWVLSWIVGYTFFPFVLVTITPLEYDDFWLAFVSLLMKYVVQFIIY